MPSHRRETRLDAARGWIAPAVLMLLVGALALYVFIGRDAPDGAGGEIALIPADDQGADAFVAVPLTDDAPEAWTRQPVAAEGITPATAEGLEPELYGGTEEELCDTVALVDRLAADPARTRAWLGALEADPSAAGQEIADVVGNLTEVVALTDLRVTRFGFDGSAALSEQAVLEKGTVVLVDEEGLPAVRCRSADPLGAPSQVPEPTFTGGVEGWTRPVEPTVVLPPAVPSPGGVRDPLVVQDIDESRGTLEKDPEGPPT